MLVTLCVSRIPHIARRLAAHTQIGDVGVERPRKPRRSFAFVTTAKNDQRRVQPDECNRNAYPCQESKVHKFCQNIHRI